MMKHLWTALFAAALVTSAAGCSKKTDEAPAEQGEVAKPVELTEQDLPVATDFEDEAEKQISAENYKGELDTLEKEIESE